MTFTFSHNSFICVKSLTVVPHKEAVFSTRTTLPLYWSMVTTLPPRVLALMLWKAMSACGGWLRGTGDCTPAGILWNRLGDYGGLGQVRQSGLQWKPG